MNIQNREQQIERGLEWLRTHDAVMAVLIDAQPRPSLDPHQNYYQELVDSIISQQLSVKAAATIFRRFVDHYGHFPTPDEIIATDPNALRACGLSYQKVRYIQDLARHVIDGTVRFDHLDDLSNEEIITELTVVKGIGEWTVHMFLIFCMGRLDVLATGDLGVKNAIARQYNLPTTPTPDDIKRIAADNSWHPYESIACRYLWKSLDSTPK